MLKKNNGATVASSGYLHSTLHEWLAVATYSARNNAPLSGQ